ncbi:acyl-CoA synthase [Melioribacter roseus P3M-2]|uniref:Acyl-CoA synthase n=1 Tax=Melioribacter roseus (strain DSM 23840 / JCM 17771 / VKM B-2668 / P3M-2) TaxID=1191523 RepID=I6Z8T8_MELRP|nr:ThuA domain-containing protein [Melioribacter roseus]AFN75570.1 acyl-CoA synthase [Melioribacter roseus P3M-2]
MKIFIIYLIITVTGVFAQNKTDLLIVTGGKAVDPSFYRIFDDNKEINYKAIAKPDAFNFFSGDSMSIYDVVLFYDTFQEMNAGQKEAFLSIFEKGIGVLFLHHAIVAHQEWDEFLKIAGARYHYTPYLYKGLKYGPSTYKHDQDFEVIILDNNHPVTKGMENFSVHDEIYINIEYAEGNNNLLGTDNCESAKYLGWTRKYKNSVVVTLLLGHDRNVYENKNFRNLISNSIEWLKKGK